MSQRMAARPGLYDDPPGTRVTPLGHGYECVDRPDRSFVRRTLSRSGQRKHDRLQELGRRGWLVRSTSGVGSVYHPDRPACAYTIAAAAMEEGLQ